MGQDSRVVKNVVVKKPIKHDEKIWAMYQRGASQNEIAKEMNMSKQNVSRVLIGAGHPTRNQRGCCSSGLCAFAKENGCKLLG